MLNEENVSTNRLHNSRYPSSESLCITYDMRTELVNGDLSRNAFFLGDSFSVVKYFVGFTCCTNGIVPKDTLTLANL